MADKTDTFHIERSTTIAAPPEVIFPYVDDFHGWRAWSPFENMDADLVRGYAGPQSGKGAVYTWEGRKSGAGRMEILESDAPRRILIQLDFMKPMKAHNTATFTFEPRGGQTHVTWAMDGPHTLMSKLMGLVFNMDKMVGPQFAEGLVKLKAAAEAKVAA